MEYAMLIFWIVLLVVLIAVEAVTAQLPGDGAADHAAADDKGVIHGDSLLPKTNKPCTNKPGCRPRLFSA